MEIQGEDQESEYWEQKMNEKNELREKFYGSFMELLPPSKNLLNVIPLINR
jgi:hypothetical protein